VVRLPKRQAILCLYATTHEIPAEARKHYRAPGPAIIGKKDMVYLYRGMGYLPTDEWPQYFSWLRSKYKRARLLYFLCARPDDRSRSMADIYAVQI